MVTSPLHFDQSQGAVNHLDLRRVALSGAVARRGRGFLDAQKSGTVGRRTWGLSSILYDRYGYGSILINIIFRGMNIHLPAILMFTRGTRF